MKPICLTALLFMVFTQSNAQEDFFSFGFNSVSIRNRELNAIMKRFNDYNTWLDRRFEPIDHLDGMVFDYSRRGDHSAFAMGFYVRNKTREASGYDTLLNHQEWWIKQRNNYGYINIAWHFVDAKHFKMGPGIGGGIGTYKIFMRAEGEIPGISNHDFVESIREHQLMAIGFYNVLLYLGNHVSLNFQPYLHVPIVMGTLVKHIYLERDLNQHNPNHIDNQTLEEWPWSYGWALTLSVFMGEE